MSTDGIPEPEGWQDALTGIDGPTFWQRVLVAEVARSLRYRRDLTIVITELDGVDRLATTFGSDAGRRAVREAAQCLRRTSRTSDYAARIGRTRFGIVLTETDEIAAINFVERIREVGPRLLPGTGDGLRFTFGWASPRLGEAPESLVLRAERRLQAELTR